MSKATLTIIIQYLLYASSFMGLRAIAQESGAYTPTFKAVDVHIVDASMDGLKTGSKR